MPGKPETWTPLRSIQKWMEDSTRCVATTFLAGLLVASLLSLWLQPLPIVHDEFSYLLAADALSQFSTSAETHEHWQHFESFHTIQQPRYASKYPPGQSLALAVGKLIGHPIIGANLTTAFAVASLMWLVIGWIPKSTHWLACLLLVTHPNIQVEWGQSYMGGSLALAGSALLLGAFFRIDKRLQIGISSIAAVGVVILLYARPMEGAVLTATILCALFYWCLTNKDVNLGPFLKRVIAPAGILIAIAAGGLAAYNHSIAGHALHMPYQIYEKQYGWVPLLLWHQPPEQSPKYNHETMQKFYEEDFNKRIQSFSSVQSAIANKSEFAFRSFRFFLKGSLVFALLALPHLVSRRRIRNAVWIALPAAIAGFMTPWSATHYLAPAASIVLLLAVVGLVHAWETTTNGNRKNNQPFVFAFIALSQLLSLGPLLYQYKSNYENGWWVRRHEIEQDFLEQPGEDLVFVRYGPEHNHHQEWVYNAIDIDSAGVVWAREISPESDAELRAHFADRNFWLLEPENQYRITSLGKE